MAFSKEEAVNFLKDVLRMPDSNLSSHPSLPFLNEIVKYYLNSIPWQCITSCSLPPSKRHLPTWEEIKQDQIAGRGGMCYENNMFMKELLSSLCFDVCYSSVQVEDPNDHMAIMVFGLSSSHSRHWVDVGSTYPLFQAIPFDFDTDFVVCDKGFLRQRFVKTSSEIVQWHHEKFLPQLEDSEFKVTNDGWYHFAKIKTDIICDLNVFESRMTDWYTVKEGNEFLQTPRAVVYENNRLIAIKGKKLIVETSAQTIERKEMKTLDQLLQTYKIHFPSIPASIVQDALNLTIFNI